MGIFLIFKLIPLISSIILTSYNLLTAASMTAHGDFTAILKTIGQSIIGADDIIYNSVDKILFGDLTAYWTLAGGILSFFFLIQIIWFVVSRVIPFAKDNLLVPILITIGFFLLIGMIFNLATKEIGLSNLGEAVPLRGVFHLIYNAQTMLSPVKPQIEGLKNESAQNPLI